MITIILAVAVMTGIFVALSVLLVVAARYLANYGTCTVIVNGGAAAFELPGGGTLLKALYEKKIFIPSACGGKGSCGYCKVTVSTGGGPILPTETPFMSRAELRAGTRLACQVKIKQNLEIQFSEVYLSVKEYRGRLSRVRQLTHDIKELTIDLVAPTQISFRPGQYVQIQAPSPEGPISRAYSISSPIFQTEKIQLVVRLVPGGIASTFLHSVNEGEELYFTGPYGDFKLPEDPNVGMICVGGGAGMAPINSIIHSLYQEWPERSCYLFFGCRTTKDVFYLETFQALSQKHPNFKVVYALSDPLMAEEPWNGDTGFIHLSADKRLEVGSKRRAFLCGPPPMIEAVTEILMNKGLRKEDIFYDKF
jgi:Na+-transporting NADH:ubiquinone oxidoreductase subunit F